MFMFYSPYVTQTHNVSQIHRIYFSFLSEKEPVQNILKGEGPFKTNKLKRHCHDSKAVTVRKPPTGSRAILLACASPPVVSHHVACCLTKLSPNPGSSRESLVLALLVS